MTVILPIIVVIVTVYIIPPLLGMKIGFIPDNDETHPIFRPFQSRLSLREIFEPGSRDASRCSLADIRRLRELFKERTTRAIATLRQYSQQIYNTESRAQLFRTKTLQSLDLLEDSLRIYITSTTVY